MLSQLISLNKRIVFQWIPSHCGILGNENADALAKKDSTATYRPVTKSTYYSVKRFIKSTYFNKQNLITQSQGKKWNSLHQNPQLIPDLPRKSSVAAFRLATGHDCLAKHLHRIGIYQSPNCPLCNSNQEMDSEHLKICASVAGHDNIFEKYWSARGQMTLFSTKQDEWDRWLPFGIFTYNTAPHCSIKFTLYELMFGRMENIRGPLRQEAKKHTKMILCKWLALLIGMTTVKVECFSATQNEEIKGQAGIYFDFVANVWFTPHLWDAISYVDIGLVQHLYDTLKQGIATIQNECSTLKKKSPERNSIALRLSEATVRSRALRLLSLGPFEGFPTGRSLVATDPENVQALYVDCDVDSCCGLFTCYTANIQHTTCTDVSRLSFCFNTGELLCELLVMINSVNSYGYHGNKVPQNRRPISLLSTLGKICEGVIYNRLYPHLQRHIPDEQFAFMSGRSTTTQLLRLTETITTAFNNKQYAAMMLLDVNKAYDTEWHTGVVYPVYNVEMTALVRREIPKETSSQRSANKREKD
ncbi:hypothetical protein ANN_07013 [Periplaneta americana]|uniref:RNase H type-1 domain-containing protein n=1 Tax=Periplaneta americana TaxID=6978 RepID=A0ABQ8TFU7_PERAM|nr:hypothetical protein ANN_07013 [Periplaneta americana]